MLRDRNTTRSSAHLTCDLGQLAAKEAKEERRTILFTGDGSMQLTVQEVATMIRRKTCPYLFVLNNDGSVLPGSESCSAMFI